MKNKYAVYVSNDNGWAEGCHGFSDVFFAYSDTYIHPVDGGIGRCGHVVVEGKSAAIALRDKLNTTGDWEDPETRAIDRPRYAIKKLALEKVGK